MSDQERMTLMSQEISLLKSEIWLCQTRAQEAEDLLMQLKGLLLCGEGELLMKKLRSWK